MSFLRRLPHGRAASTAGALPPVTHGDVHAADGPRLVGLDAIGDRGVVEVRTDRHGVLAVGMSNGRPFATGDVCRHQFAKLGRGRVTEAGCLQCPWHRAEFDVRDGRMIAGPRGRVFGFAPYSALVEAFGRRARLRTVPVELRDNAIWLLDQ